MLIHQVLSLLLLSIIAVHSAATSIKNVLKLRGGLVPQASSTDGDYYEKFTLDYGSDDKSRIAGSLRGFIKTGKLSALPQSDLFIKWMCEHLEKGPDPISGRLKPFYAADFGTKADLKKGENPKLIIVNRKLQASKDGILESPPAEVDVEVRDIWQPWLKSKCNFVVRYIVPNRTNIISIMENKKLFVAELELEKAKEKGEKDKAFMKMTFRPSLLDRLKGKRNQIIRHELDASKLTK